MAIRPSALLVMKKKVSFLFIASLLMFVTLLPIFVLEVRVDSTEELVYQQKAKVGDFFDIHWIHSVTLRPVTETYKFEALDKIPIIKMTFDEFGPNLPAHPELNQYWIIENGKFNVLGYELVFERVPVTIGAVVSNHSLIYDGKTTYLKDVYRPGGYVHIGFQKKPFNKFIIMEVVIWSKRIKKKTF